MPFNAPILPALPRCYYQLGLRVWDLWLRTLGNCVVSRECAAAKPSQQTAQGLGFRVLGCVAAVVEYCSTTASLPCLDTRGLMMQLLLHMVFTPLLHCLQLLPKAHCSSSGMGSASSIAAVAAGDY